MRRKNSWTEDELSVLREHYMDLTCAELHELIPARSAKAISSYCKSHGFRKGKSAMVKTVSRVKVFTKEQHDFFMENYVGTSSQDMADMMNAKFGTSFTGEQIHRFRQNHRLKNGRDSRWKEGHVPITKGRTWEEFMAADAQEKVRMTTCFKKGHVPKNWVPVGTILTKDDGYLWIKVADRKDVKYTVENWRMLHHVVWEKEHGPIKEGRVIVFLDGDRTNVSIGNLREVSREAKGYAHTYRDLGPEMYDVCLKAGEIKARLKDMEEMKNGEAVEL